MDFRIDEAIELLERTPVVLRALMQDLPAAWLECDEGPGTFSPREVVAHLIQGELHDWIPRARRVLEHGVDAPFEPFDRFAHRESHARTAVPALLDEFALLRARNLDALRSLPIGAADLEREGMHPDLGPVTLGQLLATWVAHDLTHLAQVARVMARRYEDEVGPWRAYLGILQWRAEAR